MKVKELKDVLWSPIGNMQSTVVYDLDEHKVVADGCSVEYAVNTYGDWELVRVGAVKYDLVLSVMGGSHD